MGRSAAEKRGSYGRGRPDRASTGGPPSGFGRRAAAAGACGLIAAVLALPALPVQAQARPVRSLLEMREERVVVQAWDLSGGAAALATVLNYQHADLVSEREVALGLMYRKEYLEDPTLVLRRMGFSLLDLKRYVEGRGYAGIGYGQLELADLIERAPVIVPVNLNGYNHFVVFRGVRGNRILVADPAWGNRTLTLDEFEAAWLTFPEFGRAGFVVAHQDGTLPDNRLAPRPQDFVFLR
jgi:predicted double-glycine peptidase